MQKLHRHLLFVCLLLISLSINIQAQPNTEVLRAIENTTWITEQYPPFNFRDPKDGEIKGIAVDILIKMFAKLDVNLSKKDLKLQPWARGYQATLKKPGTALFSTTYTEERLKLFKFVGPIVPTRVSLIAKKSRKIKVGSVEDMNGLRIGIIRDDIGDQLIRALGVDEKALTSKASVDNLVQMLYRDRLDAIAYAEDIVRHQTRLSRLDPAECEPIYLLKESRMGYAFHNSTDQAVLDALQKVLDELRDDGTADRIREAYLK